MGDLTIFNSQSQLPTHFDQTDFDSTKELMSGVMSMPPLIKLSGKTFEIVQSGEVVNQLGVSFKAIIIGVGPIAKKYFNTKYTGKETDAGPPCCASANGVTPDKGIINPQARQCAVCPHNVFGSKINELGNPTKECIDYRRLVVYVPNKVAGASKFYRLDLPTMSIKSAANYANALASRGVPLHGVVTEFSFDKDASYPRVMFDAVLVLDEAKYNAIKQEQKDPEVARILTMESSSTEKETETPAEQEAPKVAKPVPKKTVKAAPAVDTTTLEMKPIKPQASLANLDAELDDMLKDMG